MGLLFGKQKRSGRRNKFFVCGSSGGPQLLSDARMELRLAAFGALGHGTAHSLQDVENVGKKRRWSGDDLDRRGSSICLAFCLFCCFLDLVKTLPHH